MNNPVTKVVQPLGRFAAILCGYALLCLSVAITMEIVGRKLFAFSFQGIDDIGGYVLAVVAVTGAGYGVIMQSHVRIDIFLTKMPLFMQRFLNMSAMVGMSLFSCFVAWRATRVLEESIEFGSRATNPLQTPLWQPQALWLLGIYFFAAVSFLYAVHSVRLFISGSENLNRFYGPISINEDVEEELQAIAARKEAAGS